MPNWNALLNEANALGSKYDVLRRKYLRDLHEETGRNVIVYYSGWLQKPELHSPGLSITDDDKIGIMSAVHQLDRSKGLDLLLHTPGGETAATEAIVDYLRQMFGASGVRAVVPQLALSAGTMIACACKSILMGKHSSLGPVDPQFRGVPAHGVIEEFETARQEIAANPANIPLWQPIIAKYSPAFIGECQKAIKWSKELVREWLKTGMLANDPDRDRKIGRIVEELTDHSLTLSHSRHLSAEKCRSMDLIVEMLEDEPNLQEAVLSVHHACMLTLAGTGAFKIIENHLGIAFIRGALAKK
jgi:ATP-dependent protease ClpP protease subunit